MPPEKIAIPLPWLNFITYIRERFPNGEMTIKFVEGNPVKLLDAKPDIRFDKSIPARTEELFFSSPK